MGAYYDFLDLKSSRRTRISGRAAPQAPSRCAPPGRPQVAETIGSSSLVLIQIDAGISDRCSITVTQRRRALSHEIRNCRCLIPPSHHRSGLSAIGRSRGDVRLLRLHRILSACLPPSDARDSADGMASAFMSAAIRLGRERHMSYGRLNTAAMTALQRQRAMAGSSCRLEALVHRFHETDHLHGIHVVHRGLYPDL